MKLTQEDTVMSNDYINRSEATKLRIYNDGCGWHIDAANDYDCTEDVWTVYDGKEMTREEAILRAPEFAAYIGRPDLADKIWSEDSRFPNRYSDDH